MSGSDPDPGISPRGGGERWKHIMTHVLLAHHWGFRDSAYNVPPGFDSWVGKIPWRRKWQSTPVFLPGKCHGQRTLVSYSPQGSQKSQTWLGMHACRRISEIKTKLHSSITLTVTLESAHLLSAYPFQSQHSFPSYYTPKVSDLIIIIITL